MKNSAAQPPEDISPQQRMVLDQKYVALAQAHQSAATLDAKLSSTLQTSGLVVSAFGLLALLQTSPCQAHSLTWRDGLALSALVLFAASLALATISTAPKTYAYAGAIEWDEIWQKTLDVPIDAAYRQVLSDVTSATIVARDLNNRKASRLTFLSWLLVLQILLLVAANALHFAL